MTCSICGGEVQWQGPLSSLTHAKCLSCGATNCQKRDEEEDVEVATVASITAGTFPLGEEHYLLLGTDDILPNCFATLCIRPDGDDEQIEAEGSSFAAAVLALVLRLDEMEARLPAVASDAISALACTAAREVALSLAAPTTTSEEAPHAE
jgi:hypothetical protein